MSYKVIHYFTDLQDFNHPYKVGETFPRLGLKVSNERLEELASSKNKQGKPLIEKVEEVKEKNFLDEFAEKLAKEKGFFVEPMPLQADTNGSGAKGQQTNRMFSFAKKFSTRFCFCNYKDKISLNHIHMLTDDDFIGGCWSFS